MDVDSAQQVVEQKNVAVGVERTGEGYSGFLTAGESSTLLADHGLIAVSEELEVPLETGKLDGLLVAGRVEALSEDDVVLDGVIDDPGLLGDQTHGAVDSDLWTAKTLLELHFSEQRIEE